jgi:hypothetical protein
LGHEEPTILLTNQLKRSAKKLIERYAHRMLIENGIADGIDFFHMDALSSAVVMKVNVDLQLTLMASSLYRLLGVEIGHGFKKAKSRQLFQDFVDANRPRVHHRMGRSGAIEQARRRADKSVIRPALVANTSSRFFLLGPRVARFVYHALLSPCTIGSFRL